MLNYTSEIKLPSKILYKSNNICGIENIFKPKTQIAFDEQEKIVFNGKGKIIIDFGKEYYGVLQLMVGNIIPENNVVKLRINLGESLAECCSEYGRKSSLNNHGVKFMEFDVMMFSEIQTSYCGFRFAEIEVLTENCTFELINCKLISKQDNINRVGYFSCDDERVNDIFNTAVRTIELCQQNGYVWDGIKRDRIVWIGDLHPEALSIMYLSGDYNRIINSLSFTRHYAPLPSWLNNIPSYSMWYIIILYEVFLRNGNVKCVEDNFSYIIGILEQFNESVSSDGSVDFAKIAYDCDMKYFLDWATFEKEDAEVGVKCLLIYTLNIAKKLLQILGEETNLCDVIRDKIIGYDKEVSYKQVKAIQCFSKGYVELKDIEVMAKNGASGLSTFMAYYILKSLAEGGANEQAFNIMKEYYGAMLDLGATTFWEDFDIEWLKDNPLPITAFEQEGRKHIHADYGKYCYKNFRHSLCHGWSSGVIPYIFEKIVGLSIIEPGYKKIKISPNLCGLKEINAGISTPFGCVKIHIKDNNGKIEKQIDAPSGVEVIF